MAISEELKTFIKTTKWAFAKTYAKTWPHEWVVRNKIPENVFMEFANLITSEGYDGSFYRKKQTYYSYNGNEYWIMAAGPWAQDKTCIINRTPTELVYMSRAKNNLYPDTQEWADLLAKLEKIEGWGSHSLRKVYDEHIFNVRIKG
jgi:hypothetical protein